MPTAHDDAVAALLHMRDVGGALHAELVQQQPVAQHHLQALRAVEAGARSLAAVADATDRHVSSVSRLIDQLVGAELLLRTPDPDDRRHVVLRLTEQGQALANRFAALDRAMTSRMVQMLSEDEAALLASILTRMAVTATEIVAELEVDPSALDELL